MIGNRIKPIEGFNAISMSTALIYDAPTDSRQANHLRCLGVLNGALYIDFQGVKAKINIPDQRVNHRQ